MPPLSAETLARLESLHKAATPAPWSSILETIDGPDGEPIADDIFGDTKEQTEANAGIIAESRNAPA